MAYKTYRELLAWQESVELVTSIYQGAALFPRDERFTLTSQMRRAAISIASNIAEEQGRGTLRDFLHFLTMSYGSLRELETQVVIAHRLGYLQAEQFSSIETKMATVGKLINGLKRGLVAHDREETDST